MNDEGLADVEAANLCLPLIRPIEVTPLAAGIRDGGHPRAEPPLPCRRSAAGMSRALLNFEN